MQQDEAPPGQEPGENPVRLWTLGFDEREDEEEAGLTSRRQPIEPGASQGRNLC